MMRSLPSRPGYACVTRIDWMISLILRSTRRSWSCTSSPGSSRWRTNCWVIVDAPRASPEIVSRPAAMMLSGSKPVLVQNDLSSTAVVASIRTGGRSVKSTTSRRSPELKRASSVSPSRA